MVRSPNIRYRTAGTAGALVLALAGATACVPAQPVVMIDAQPAPIVVTDAMVADMVIAYDEGRIETARLALQKAANPEVRTFAQHVRNEHTASNERAHTLLRATGVAPTPTPTLDQIRRSSSDALQSLRTHEGAAFDRAYIQHELAMHRYMLGLMDQTLLPAARNIELRTFLNETRAALVHHEQRAAQLRNVVGR